MGRRGEAFLLRPNQEREFEVPYKIPIVFAKDTQGNDIQRHPAPESGMINVGNITQYETLWSMKKPCFLPKWLLVYVPKDVRRNCKSWEAVDPADGRPGKVMLQQTEAVKQEDKGKLQEENT